MRNKNNNKNRTEAETATVKEANRQVSSELQNIKTRNMSAVKPEEKRENVTERKPQNKQQNKKLLVSSDSLLSFFKGVSNRKDGRQSGKLKEREAEKEVKGGK